MSDKKCTLLYPQAEDKQQLQEKIKEQRKQLLHYLCGFVEKGAQATKEVKISSTGVPEKAC